MFNFKKENGKFIVKWDGKIRSFHTMIGAFRFIKYTLED